MRNLSVVAVLLCGACRHAGAGEGVLQTPKTPTGASQSKGNVEFKWSSGADTSSGEISAVLPDQSRYEGTYLQVTATSRADSLAPYYNAWVGPRWGSSGPWYSGDTGGFVTAYSGRAVAHLTSDDGTRMRCTFSLREPSSGLLKGGIGECQLSSGETVFGAEMLATSR
jgi:hypothetical protein